MEDFILNGAIASIQEDFAHPGLKHLLVVFCDDKPNENGQGVAYEDFADIKKTAIGTPVKMRFLGNGVGGHVGSIPIGFIQNMHEKELEDGTHQLVAEAILFASEYPDEVQYLSESHAAGTAPGISWELSHTQPSILKDGIQWLKGLITRAATFVRDPAYGNRTAILAMASNRSLSDDDFIEGVREIVEAASWSSEYINSLPDSSFACVDKSGRHYPFKDANGKVDLPHLRAALSRIGDPSNTQCGKSVLLAAAKKAGIGTAELEDKPKNTDTGGNNRMEEEIQKLQAKVAELETTIQTQSEELASVKEANGKLTTDLAARDTELAEFKNKEVLAEREKALTEAGMTVTLKPERILGMNDEEFASYIEEVKAIVEATKAEATKQKPELSFASRRQTTPMPKFTGKDDNPTTDLAARLRVYSRTKPETE